MNVLSDEGATFRNACVCKDRLVSPPRSAAMPDGFCTSIMRSFMVSNTKSVNLTSKDAKRAIQPQYHIYKRRAIHHTFTPVRNGSNYSAHRIIIRFCSITSVCFLKHFVVYLWNHLQDNISLDVHLSELPSLYCLCMSFLLEYFTYLSF